MLSVLEGTVTYVEEKSIKRDGKPEERYRTVTVLQNPAGSKPELQDVKVLGGLKVEMGQKSEMAGEVHGIPEEGFPGQCSGRGPVGHGDRDRSREVIGGVKRV